MRDCRIYFTTSIRREFIDVTGWQLVVASDYSYSGDRNGMMAIFERSAKSGDVIEIPQGNWTGGILLIPSEK